MFQKKKRKHWKEDCKYNINWNQFFRNSSFLFSFPTWCLIFEYEKMNNSICKAEWQERWTSQSWTYNIRGLVHRDIIFKWHFHYIGFNRKCHEKYLRWVLIMQPLLNISGHLSVKILLSEDSRISNQKVNKNVQTESSPLLHGTEEHLWYESMLHRHTHHRNDKC